MENASKFLIIAGSIIISLVLVGLGVMIYQRVAPSITGAGVDEYEVTQFNSKFDGYFGTSVTGSNVKGLISTVLRSNQQVENDDDADSKTVYVVYKKSSDDAAGTVYGGPSEWGNQSLTKLSTDIKSSTRYRVDVEETSNDEAIKNGITSAVAGYYKSGFYKCITVTKL